MSKEKTTKQAPANTVKTADGIEIYTSKIYELVDDYINMLPDPANVTSRNFTGICQYVYENFIGDLLNNKYNKSANRYPDIKLLDNLFNIYTSLCCKYNQLPYILEFTIFTGISRDIIHDWKNNNRRELTPEYVHTAKRWYAECELAQVKEKDIKSIFLLKSNFGYAETAPVHVDTKQAIQADALPVFGLECENAIQSAQKIIDVDMLENE